MSRDIIYVCVTLCVDVTLCVPSQYFEGLSDSIISNDLTVVFVTIYYYYFIVLALDPLFWVAHGAMERMFQKAVFAGIFTDMDYTSSDHCSGHDSEIGKYWLKGFYFANETIAAIDLTNSELTAILDPTSHKYRDLINFVYDTSSYSWCAAADSWFE